MAGSGLRGSTRRRVAIHFRPINLASAETLNQKEKMKYYRDTEASWSVILALHRDGSLGVESAVPITTKQRMGHCVFSAYPELLRSRPEVVVAPIWPPQIIGFACPVLKPLQEMRRYFGCSEAHYYYRRVLRPICRKNTSIQ